MTASVHSGGLAAVVASGVAAVWMAGAAWGGTPAEVCEALRAHPADRAMLQQLRQAVADAPEDPKRTAYMVAYSLGCLHAGLLDEGRRTRAFLTSRLGSDPAVARLESGRLDVSCSACAGEPRARAACAACGGSGASPSPSAVAREYLALLDELTGHAAPAVAPAPPPPSATATSAPAWRTMQEFVAMMQSLREQARSDRIETADLSAVIAHPREYAGRAVRSSGFVIGYHAKQITVSPDADLSSRVRLDLAPDSLYVGTKVGVAFRKTGQPVPVTLVFALIHGSQNVGFLVDPVQKPTREAAKQK